MCITKFHPSLPYHISQSTSLSHVNIMFCGAGTNALSIYTFDLFSRVSRKRISGDGYEAPGAEIYQVLEICH